MDAGVAAAGPDVALEGGLLGGVEDVAGGGEPDHRLVLREVGVGELGGVLGGGDGETVLGAELLDGGDALVDGVMAVTGRLGEDQDVELVLGLGRRRGDRDGEGSRERDERGGKPQSSGQRHV